uniref:Small ribosomal subunit protein uS17c n=1 Tax=Pedospumella sp. Jangsampo120217C5 TaxID=2782409 RepID=A0A7S6PV19_9STRA|nr:ribosomal protein S17 [Pedospumella sp. Jangsampo120217C5]|tara:strand:+ start:228 stop:476 length:249 start_codon:yes stop_codon:yes gene_type:complete
MVKKKRVGVVVSNKPDKTVVVAVQTRYQHPKYSKMLIKTKRYMVHDEHNISRNGDFVLIEESIPLSKHKKWVLKETIKSSLN